MEKANSHTKRYKTIKRLVIIVSLVFISGLLITYTGLRIWIKTDLDRICKSAMSQYNGDRIEALISVLNSESQDLKAKNDAIWALEYLGDERALQVLKELQTGTKCVHNQFVCQRQLQRAIDYIEGNRFSIMR